MSCRSSCATIAHSHGPTCHEVFRGALCSMAGRALQGLLGARGAAMTSRPPHDELMSVAGGHSGPIRCAYGDAPHYPAYSRIPWTSRKSVPGPRHRSVRCGADALHARRRFSAASHGSAPPSRLWGDIFGVRNPAGRSIRKISSASTKETRFCLAALAFRFETLYLARRFYGLHNCNVNPELPAYPSLALPFRPGKQGLYAALRAYAIERPTHGCALVQRG